MKKNPGLYRRDDSPRICRRDMISLIMSILMIAAFLGTFESTARAQITAGQAKQVQINEGDEWHYFKGLQDPPERWNRSEFDASNWRSGPSGLGYGSGSNRTYLGDMQGNYSTVYARREIMISNPDTAKRLMLSVVCDGPFIAYLNGIEVIRTNTIQLSAGDASNGAFQPEQYDISGFVHELFPGNNLLALQCENNDIHSEDFSFIPAFEVMDSEGGIQ